MSEALPEYVERCEVIFKLRKHGVIFDDPLRVDIDPRAVIMPGVRIGANVAIIGESTQINAGAVIAGESRIIRSVIGTGSVVTTSFVEDSVVENDVRIGPFSRVRDQSRIRAHVVIGNFVEIKRSEIREGTRIHHQCYIGDTTVGKGVNIGAGVITANYDGERKHGTIIGDHAFIGCHATLRAPVSIGEGAIVGAGAVVLCNVEDGQTVVGIPAHPLSRKA